MVLGPSGPGTKFPRAASFTNFGGNVRFAPRYWYMPRTEGEVLELLDRHSTGKVRVAGSRHSWSDAAASTDALLDLRRLNRVEIENGPDGRVTMTVGGGCTIQRLLDVLHRETGATLPTMGVIKKQTIAGAVSTGTHGSGRSSLSHYVDEVRVAAYDPSSGKARIYQWGGGTELRGARCSLGCMGVILSVKIQCVPQYYVEEAVLQRKSLEQVLQEAEQFPLQQFVLLPHSWKYFAYQRRRVEAGDGHGHVLKAYWARAVKLLAVDFLLHFLLKLVILLTPSRQGSSRFIMWFYRALLPGLMSRKRRVIDVSEKSITMRHDLFQHLEMEVFVPSQELPRAVSLIHSMVSVFAGSSDPVPQEVTAQFSAIGKLEELMRCRGNYTHHYPIFFRQVLPDDTLISMTSGSRGPYYSISFFTYLSPEDREHFCQFARFIAQCLTRLVGARLHWGKYYPLTLDDIQDQYPQLEEFRRLCGRVDPRGVFQNDFTLRVLGFGADPYGSPQTLRQELERSGRGEG